MILKQCTTNELKNIKQTLNNWFPNYIVDTEIEHIINKAEHDNIDKNPKP